MDCVVIRLIGTGFRAYHSLTRGYTDMGGSGARACGAWRVWLVVAHGACGPSWHMARVARPDTRHGTCAGLDADMCSRREHC